MSAPNQDPLDGFWWRPKRVLEYDTPAHHHVEVFIIAAGVAIRFVDSIESGRMTTAELLSQLKRSDLTGEQRALLEKIAAAF